MCCLAACLPAGRKASRGPPSAWRRWALPAQLQERIAGHIQYNESRSGWWKQCCFGICVPSGEAFGGGWCEWMGGGGAVFSSAGLRSQL